MAGTEPVSGAAELVAHAHHAPSSAVTLVFTAVLIGMVLTLALEERLHAKKSVITGIYAVLSLALGHATGILPFGPVVNVFGEALALPVYIQGIDWGVIAIILGSSLFVDVTSRSGLFTFIAIKLTKASGGDPFRLLVAYGLMTVVFSALLNNVTAMIIVGSLTAVSLEKLGAKDKLLGFLLIEGLLTNIGGLLTLISSVPNIIVGAAAGISFVAFFRVAAGYVVVATTLTLLLGARRYGVTRLRLESARREAREQVQSFDERDGIESQGFFVVAAVMLVAFIVSIAASSVLEYPLGMGFVAMAFGLVMLLRFKGSADRFYRTLDWDLLLFFAFLFIVINVMEHAAVLTLIGEGLGAIIALNDVADGAGTAATLVSAAGFSAVTDNIPLAAMLARILEGMAPLSDGRLWWSVIFGANLGGNLTPIGSASTVVAVTLMHKHGLAMSFGAFVKAAAGFALLQIALAVLYVIFAVPLLA
ncbi:MAG: SLC13 family permease [Myxococcota bacterium]